jgi:hypothetical protein
MGLACVTGSIPNVARAAIPPVPRSILTLSREQGSFGTITTAVAYYVSPTGSDANDGLTMETPFATPNAALAFANPGEQILLQRGAIWTRELTIGAPGITLAAYGAGAAPVIDADGDANGITVDTADDVTVRDIEIRNSDEYLVKLRNCFRAAVRDCYLHHCTRTGLACNSGGGDHTINNVEIAHCGGAGSASGERNGILFLPTTTGASTVSNSYIHDCGDDGRDHGIYSLGGANMFVSNRINNINGYGIKCKVDSAGTSVLSNQLDLCRSGAVQVDNETTTVRTAVNIDHNSAYNCGQYPSGLSPYAAFWVSGYGRARLVNNISIGSEIGIQVDTNAGLTESDYNNITTTGDFGNWKGTVQATIAAWRTASGTDAHSVTGNIN